MRNRLDDKDIGQWHQHTRFTKLTGFVVRELRSTIQPELCTGAWYVLPSPQSAVSTCLFASLRGSSTHGGVPLRRAKMYEMLHHFELLPADLPRVSTIHLCEAPGGFIAATNHYLRRSHATCQSLVLTTSACRTDCVFGASPFVTRRADVSAPFSWLLLAALEPTICAVPSAHRAVASALI